MKRMVKKGKKRRGGKRKYGNIFGENEVKEDRQTTSVSSYTREDGKTIYCL